MNCPRFYQIANLLGIYSFFCCQNIQET